MRGGFLQQVDAPQVLYARPHNLFVAEFIGSPAMNLVIAALERTDGEVWVRFGPHRVRLEQSTQHERPALHDFEGRPVVVGIRPEDMEDASVLRETHESRRISILCDIREDMGSEVYVHFNVDAEPVASKEVVEALVIEAPEDEEARLAADRERGAGVPFVARLDRSSAARERQPLELEVDVTRLHFFDPETGLRVGGDVGVPAQATATAEAR
jgi:multiple sugar transport system ATP-binding protein